MAVRIGHASIEENGRATGGKAGDQTGKEACHDISGSMRRNQISPDLIGQSVFLLDHGKDGSDQDDIDSLDQIQKKQISDHVAVVMIE